MTKRNILIILIIIPIIGLVTLFGVALIKTKEPRTGLVVNSQFSESSIDKVLAPDFTVKTLDGQYATLSELQGKVVMIDFWSSWCPPCRAEASQLGKVFNSYQDSDLEFIGIAIWDRKEEVEEFIRLYNVPYVNALDNDGIIAIDYGVRGIPEKYFINKNGYIVKKFIGPLDSTKLEEILNLLLLESQ